MSESDLKDDDRRYHLRLCCFWGILSFVFLLSGNLAAFNVDSGQKLFLIYKTQIVSPVKRLDLQTLPQDSHQGSYRKGIRASSRASSLPAGSAVGGEFRFASA